MVWTVGDSSVLEHSFFLLPYLAARPLAVLSFASNWKRSEWKMLSSTAPNPSVSLCLVTFALSLLLSLAVHVGISVIMSLPLYIGSSRYHSLTTLFFIFPALL